MRLILCGVQSPINIGMILRSAEIYHTPVSIWDRFGVLADREKLRTISDFACGALQRSPPFVTDDWSAATTGGRCIATDISGDCIPHTSFIWRETDQILVGNEYDGVPQEAIASVEATVTIPMPDGYFPKPTSASPIDPTRSAPPRSAGQPSLNAAVAASILISTAYALRIRR